MASGDAVAQIKDRLTIVDVVSPYVELHKAGKNYKGKSPFTNEKTPSFYVSPDRGMYYCFSTSQGGDIFTFVEVMEGVDFKGALKILAEKAGVELVPEDPKKKTERDRQYDLLEAVTVFYQHSLGQKKEASDYLARRGVKPETVAKWRIGYAPGPPEHGWREARTYLTEKKFSDTEQYKAGVIKGMDTGKEPYDVFRDRIMFPIFDQAGRVVAFSGRILSKDSEVPKYVNSPETELFNKSEILYGYDKAKAGIRHYDFSLIVEGQFDVVMSHQAGYGNAVAVSGTALTPYHVMLLQRLSNRVVLALDGDRAGIAAVKRAADLMLARGMDVKVARMTGGKDPADIIAGGVADFKKVIGHATHVIEYLLEVLSEETKDERTFKLRAREEILPYVVKIPNYIDQEHFEHLIADRLKTTKDAIHLEVQRLAETTKRTNHEEDVVPTLAKPVASVKSHSRFEELFNYVVALSELVSGKEKSLIAKAVESLTGQSLAEAVAKVDPGVLSKLTFSLETEASAADQKIRQQQILDVLNELSKLGAREALKNERGALSAAEASAAESEIKAILARITTLQKALESSPYGIDHFDE